MCLPVNVVEGGKGQMQVTGNNGAVSLDGEFAQDGGSDCSFVVRDMGS